MTVALPIINAPDKEPAKAPASSEEVAVNLAASAEQNPAREQGPATGDAKTATRVSPYWRSLNDLDQSPEFQEFVKREFPQQAEDFPEGVSRRRWMQIMGASFALAGAQGCRWQTEKIVPFANRPDGYVPGTSTHFATSVEWGGASRHLVVTCYDGRPIKVEGNQDHPCSLGGAEVFSQSATLSLYDPDRQAQLLWRDASKKKDQKVALEGDEGWAEFDKLFSGEVERLRSTGGAGFGVLMQPSTSATIGSLLGKIASAMPDAKFYEHAPVSRGNELAGSELAFGRRLRTHFDLKPTRVVAAFDSDLLHDRPDSLTISRGWSENRDVDAEGFSREKMCRLYSVESQFTSTGSVADHRLAARASEMTGVLAELRDLVASGHVELPHDEQSGAHGGEEKHVAQKEHHDGEHPGAPTRDEFLKVLASDLLSAKGASAVAVGAHLPPEAHAIAHEINGLLENVGKTVSYTEEPAPATRLDSIAALVGDIAAGRIETLLILGGNPVFDAPADIAFADGLQKVATSIHLSAYDNETSRLCTWSLPETHPFESWGDAEGWDGTPSVGQPLIEPLMNGRSAIEVLALVAGDAEQEPQDLVRGAVASNLEDKDWRKLLHDGCLPDTAATKVNASITNRVEPQPLASEKGLEVVFRPSTQVFDGRFANNGWLQEAPEFITKLTWDNAAIVSPATSKAIGAGQGEMIRIATPSDTEIDLPVFVVPGTADNTIGVQLGYGRQAAGRVGGFVAEKDGEKKYKDVVVGQRGNWGELIRGATGIAPPVLSVPADPVGHDVYPIRTSRHADILPGVTVKALGRNYLLATTQDHFSIDEVGLDMIDRRTGDLVREGTIEQYEDQADFAKHVGHHVPEIELWEELPFNYEREHGGHGDAGHGEGGHDGDHGHDEHDSSHGRDKSKESKDGRAWGMAIDLNKCLGCNACVVACQAENNVPVVGKDQVARGREMHWIRIDRYFHGSREAPHVAYQPLSCQQCETAPCEQVCPVAATIHSDEGLNDMVYNRCIGTRYCANNCPFKVRRFNYFSYTNRFRHANNELMRLVNNPEVTVRSRGVMEKCNYCVQRIAAARIKAKTDGRPNPGKIEDHEISMACQQSCSTNAITFGDLNDLESKVRKKHNSPRAYGLLDGLRLKPRTLYLARVRNPHPALEKYYPTAGGAHGGHGGEHENGHGDDHGDSHSKGHANHTVDNKKLHSIGLKYEHKNRKNPRHVV